MLAAEHALDTACMMHSSCVLGVLLSGGAASRRNKLLPTAGLWGKTSAPLLKPPSCKPSVPVLPAGLTEHCQ